MTERLRPAVGPAYLFLCLLLGGSPQGMWGNALLRLLAIAIIAWALIERRDQALPRAARHLLIIIMLAVALVLAQLIPLPVEVWMELPGRATIAEGFQLLGIAPTAMPISLAPYDSIAALLALLPALGMLAATIGLRAYSSAWLAVALIAGASAGVLLGIMQVSSPIPEQSPWYIYRISNFGVATGFFANSNHMANLLLVTIPFIAAAGAKIRERSQDVRARTAGLTLASSGLLVIILGLILNQSLAGYGLGVPVVLASLLILFSPSRKFERSGLVVIGLAGFIAVALLWTRPVGSNFDRLGASTSVTSRQEIAAQSVTLAKEFAPFGSGLGTFADVYRWREDPGAVDRYYVNHAHNDYLELAVETGVPGILLGLLFLAWWGAAVARMLRSPASDQFAMAGAIASVAILLHSAVDYPLRTAAISAVFAMCLALILQSRRTAVSENDLRPARHVVVG